MHSCFYCGDTTQKIHRDHVRPVSMQSVSRNYDKSDTVPCCAECNMTLGGKIITTVEERSAYLLERYSSKYRKALKVPDRTEEELSEYGERMRSTIRACMVQKKWIIERLEYLSKTSVGMYDPSKIEHLRGLTSIQKSVIYRMLKDFFANLDVGVKPFSEKWAERIGVDEKGIMRILEEREHFDVSMSYKYENGYPLDVTVLKWRTILKKNAK